MQQSLLPKLKPSFYARDLCLVYAYSKDSDQTAWICSLVWVSTVCKMHEVPFHLAQPNGDMFSQHLECQPHNPSIKHSFLNLQNILTLNMDVLKHAKEWKWYWQHLSSYGLTVTSLWLFLPFYQRETTPVASVSCSPTKRRANSFLLEWTSIYKGSQTETDTVISLVKVC